MHLARHSVTHAYAWRSVTIRRLHCYLHLNWYTLPERVLAIVLHMLELCMHMQQLPVPGDLPCPLGSSFPWPSGRVRSMIWDNFIWHVLTSGALCAPRPAVLLWKSS